MAGFVARSLDSISSLIRGDMRREAKGTDATINENLLYVLSKVVAMAIHLVEFRAAYIYRQIFTSTADELHLLRQAYEFGMAKKPASAASGRILTTGTPGTVYPAGIGFLSGNVLYRSVSDAEANGDGDLSLQVVAETTGALTNREADAVVTLVDPALYPTIGANATVGSAGIGGGADAENKESLRARILHRKRYPPQGGAYTDYERFALEIPGVVKAWAWPFAYGPGTVGVWFLFDGRTNYIPSIADVDAVQSTIEARRLIRARLEVSAPVAKPIDITIAGLDKDTTETRAAIRSGLESMFFDRAKPGVAIEPSVFSMSWISEAISGAVGEGRHVLKSPLTDPVCSNGEYPILGTISYE